MAIRTTQERWEKLILLRDSIITEANLKGAAIPLNSDFPEIILGIQRISYGLPPEDVEALLDSILGEIVVGDYAVKGQAILDAKEAMRQALITQGVDTPIETPLSAYATSILSIVTGIPVEAIKDLFDTINYESVEGEEWMDKAERTIVARDAINAAINGKGVALEADAPISTYAPAIASISSGETPEVWNIPADWIGDIENVADGEIKMLVTDSNILRLYISTTVGTKLNIDWGDGVIENNISNYYPTHDYTAAAGGVYVESVKRKMWVVRIWASDGAGINTFNAYHTINSYPMIEPTPIIAINLAANNLTSYASIVQYTTNNGCFSPLLEYVKIKYFANTCTTPFGSQGAFGREKNIKRIDLPTSWNNVTNAGRFLQGCASPLITVNIPDSWGSVTDASNFCVSATRLKTLNLPTSWGNVTTVESMFSGCSSLEKISIPENWGLVTNCSSMFASCTNLNEVVLPAFWGSVTNPTYMFSNSGILKAVLPNSWGNVTNVTYMFGSCTFLQELTLPETWGNITVTSHFLNGCNCIKNINLPASWAGIVAADSMFRNCDCLSEIVFPNSWGNITNISHLLYGCSSLRKVQFPSAIGNITNASYALYKESDDTRETEYLGVGYIGSGTQNCNFTEFSRFLSREIAWTLNSRVSKLKIIGYDTSRRHSLSSLRLPNAINSAFDGSSPQIELTNCSLDAAALNLLFGDLPVLTGKTIKITGNPGAATCDPTIATSKGWTVTTT